MTKRGGKDRERTGYRGQGIGWRDKRKCKVQKEKGKRNRDCHGTVRLAMTEEGRRG
jgi:hypothetical protein